MKVISTFTVIIMILHFVHVKQVSGESQSKAHTRDPTVIGQVHSFLCLSRHPSRAIKATYIQEGYTL